MPYPQDLPLAFDYMKIDFQFPKEFPVNTIQIMRALRAVQQIAPQKLEKATDAFFVRNVLLLFCSLRGSGTTR